MVVKISPIYFLTCTNNFSYSISWLQSPFIVILEPKKIKSVTASTFYPSICHEVMGPGAMIIVFECWVLSQLFHSPLSPSSRGSLVPLHFLPLEWYHLHIWDCWYFSWQSRFQLVIHPAWRFAWCTLHMFMLGRYCFLILWTEFGNVCMYLNKQTHASYYVFILIHLYVFLDYILSLFSRPSFSKTGCHDSQCFYWFV